MRSEKFPVVCGGSCENGDIVPVMTSTTTTTEIATTAVLPVTETAHGMLRSGERLVTTVDADRFLDSFTATRVAQGRIQAIGYNVTNGGGSHFGVTAHGVTGVKVEGNATDTGLTITITTESGQALTVDLFSVKLGDDVRQPITLVVAEGTVTA